MSLDLKRSVQTMIKQTKTCDRCEEEYEFYIVLIKDDFNSVAEYVNGEYDNLCKPCRAFLHPNQPFPGADKVTPKEDV